MPCNESIVVRLIRFRETGNTAVAAQGRKFISSAGYDLMGIALVADVKYDTVDRTVVNSVKCNGQLYCAEV